MASLLNCWLYISSKVDSFRPHIQGKKESPKQGKNWPLIHPQPSKHSSGREFHAVPCMPQLVAPFPATALGLMENLEAKSHQSPPKTSIGGWGQRGDWPTEELKTPENTLFRSFTDFASYCKINCKFPQVSWHLSQLAADPWPPPAPNACLYF